MKFRTRIASYLGLLSFLLFITTILTTTVALYPSAPNAQALTPSELNIFSQNNILFYDPSACNTTPVDNGIFMGEPFTEMTDELLVKFAAAGINENGPSGEAFELSLLANLYEKVRCSNDSCLHTASDLADYFKNGGWFGTNNATQTSFDNGVSVNNGEPDSEALAIAKSVLVEGRRVIPQGVDEHDDVALDVTSVTLDGQQVDKMDQNNYVSGKTVITNRFGATYTFYAWCDGEKSKSGNVTSMCDPFGSIDGVTVDESYSVATTTGDNLSYDGTPILSDAQLQQVEDNRSAYEEAGNEYNMPWQILAALHYREHNLQVDNPSNGQGIYQLYSYTSGGTNENSFPAGPVDDAEFLRQTKLAAEFIRGYMGDADLTNENNVKSLFFQYNGTAQTYKDKAICLGFTEEQANYGEGSPYVMNKFDAQRDPDSASMSECWPGAYKGDHVWDPEATESRPGAFVVYMALGGATGSDSTCRADYSSKGELIAQTALDLSWDASEGHAYNDPKPEYRAAMEAIGNFVHPNGDTSIPEGASCDQFVATVMRFSGADEEYNLWSADGSGTYMANHPEKYTEIEFDGSNPEILQPGDIFATYDSAGHGHIWIYVEIDGSYGRADASFNDRTAEHYPTSVPTINDGRPYRVFRRTN